MKLHFLSIFYKNVLKNIFFLFDAETTHNFATSAGEIIGKTYFNTMLKNIFSKRYPSLEQEIGGIKFKNPIGLAAGFDYDGRLTQILPSLGFGLETVGTITNLPYKGNSKPRLGRLPKSKSLMVNKGFKNEGAVKISQNLAKSNFEIPLGISIGMTNPGKTLSEAKSASDGQKTAIEDILSAFRIFEDSNIKSSYYELNISCPNLFGNISFYPPKNLDELLTAVDRLKITKPIIVKMPINKTDKQILGMLEVISKHNIKGVIFGNLQKDRNDSALFPDEVKKFKKGNFSGKPTEKRSNELIAFAYRHFKKRFLIIGCGGIFSAKDAYKKIKLGASLVQLITGLIYEGPTLIYEINKNLSEMIKKDGFKNINEAVGVDNKN
ncbi:MAG: dihydroorotate dehydrogenase (quinone) [Candidatus Levybacteria bacterium RBG_13_35_9]|nr:MAG: dihydroorotate dehydrogenase (quinone) [Candidatus Levybacteria bacterium RBG_13_35_9]